MSAVRDDVSLQALLQRIAMQPGLLAEHAGAYAELAALEARTAALAWRRRLLWLAAALLVAGAALVLTGVAGLLWAALPATQMPAPEVLLWLPLGTWVVAALCGLMARRAASSSPTFAHLREQWRTDFQWLRASIGGP